MRKDQLKQTNGGIQGTAASTLDDGCCSCGATSRQITTRPGPGYEPNKNEAAHSFGTVSIGLRHHVRIRARGFEVGGDPGRPEGVATDHDFQATFGGSALDQCAGSKPSFIHDDANWRSRNGGRRPARTYSWSPLRSWHASGASSAACHRTGVDAPGPHQWQQIRVAQLFVAQLAGEFHG
jgi:hypothetical protein